MQPQPRVYDVADPRRYGTVIKEGPEVSEGRFDGLRMQAAAHEAHNRTLSATLVAYLHALDVREPRT